MEDLINNIDVIMPIVAIVLVKVLPAQYTLPVKLLADFVIKVAESKPLNMEKSEKAKAEMMDEAISKIAEVANKNTVGVTIDPEHIERILEIAKGSKGFNSFNIHDLTDRYLNMLRGPK